jgi:outer membrane receptor for ferrienterochelin and colicins
MVVVQPMRPVIPLLFVALLVSWPCSGAQPQGSIRVHVRTGAAPVGDAQIVVNGATYRTADDGNLLLAVPAGAVSVTVSKEGFAPLTSTVTVAAGQTQAIEFELQVQPTIEEEVIVSATRTDKRLEDQPMRVEVVPAEEVQEKIMMTPGDVSMLLNETNGLRVQTTSPSLGGASVRIQGLRGRYTQILADGLPLYGGQTGSIGLLQIPPMDLGQVEVIKGVASALYGMSAIGGVINLVSRRPPAVGHEREVLVNRTTHGGTDVVNWLAAPIAGRWAYTFVGGAHFQDRSDLDEDGWTDLPMYRRATARPRLFWDDGEGKSVLIALGGMAEERRGGTMPGRVAPDGTLFPENLDTARFDVGAVGRIATAGGRVVALRGSATKQGHTHGFGETVERDDHRTMFGEASITGSAARHTWVAGAALQQDHFTSRDVSRFNYTHTVPGVFGQDEIVVTSWLTASGSARLDVHSEFGTFMSPRVTALMRPRDAWTVRASVGRGYFAPTPFTEETEATGLSPVAPLGDLEPERADNISIDVTWARVPFEVTATLFYARIDNALTAVDTGRTDFPVAVVNADGQTRTRGTEFIARYHREEFDIIVTHMYLWSTEPVPDGPRLREIPLNPRHSASFDLLHELGPVRVGFEVFYTGRQALEDNPYRAHGFAHVLYGALMDWAIGSARVFVNIENIGDVRQTREDPLVRPARHPDGRWTVDAWAPLEGRTLNAGLRLRF